MLPPSEISSPTVMDSGASSPGERAAALVVLAALERAARVILGNVDRLGLIDAAAGDGDHGVGMRRGIEAAVEAFRGGVLAGTGVAEDLELAGRSWADTAGGTSGALWGAALEAAGRALHGVSDPGPAETVGAARAAIDEVRALGGAEPGDKTMVDAMVPYLRTLTDTVAAGRGLRDALRAAAIVAEDSAAATSQLLPKLGRARPLAAKSLGHPDAGAVSFALIAAALADTGEEKREEQ